MIKGQLSIDFMLTVVAVLIFTQLFLTFSNNYLDNATELNIRQQEKLIALQMASIINETYSLSGGNTSIQFKIPWIYEGNKPAGQDCNITLVSGNPPQIKIDYARDGKLITTIQKIADIPAGAPGLAYEELPNKFFCGGTLEYDNVVTP